MASGDVRFVFRSEETDVNVTIEGQKEWVAKIVEELGLSEVGLTMPLGGAFTQSLMSKSSVQEGDDESESEAPLDMGPTPDPSRIPTVRRPIGALNIEAELEKIGLEPPGENDVIELIEMFSELEKPRPIQGQMSIDPMAEAWLRELMRLVVRDGARTALATEVIEEVASSKLGSRTGVELTVWLESLFAAGKLVKIHGGNAVGWGPSPRWLS